ncbi:MAG: 3-coathanger stack domain-containing protein, partial [Leadbetterella sp.]
MKSIKCSYLFLMSLLLFSEIMQAQELITYPTIPGRSPSDKYTCRVRKVGTTTWQDAFVLQTVSKPNATSPSPNNGYVSDLKNWTASWIAFEFSGGAVEVEIALASGVSISGLTSITQAMVRPVGHASSAVISNGKVYVTFTQPANVNVDINNQMEGQYTGMFYGGSPIHTISLFANPVYKKPTLTNPRVFQLNPGETIPPTTDTSWDTLYFKPGIHHIPIPYVMNNNKTLYIPGDAVVHGTVHSNDLWGFGAYHDWSVYGSGTVSGEEIPWVEPLALETTPFARHAYRVKLEGFVVADPAHHVFFVLNTTNQPENKNYLKNLKVLAWRLNSDGVNPDGNTDVRNCFFRCQDDNMKYPHDNGSISDCVCWSDFNGSALYVDAGGTNSSVNNITVIYHRAAWHYWKSGRTISFRDVQPGMTMQNINIKNVLVEDPLPAFPPFFFEMNNPNNSNAPITLTNVNIENVRQDYPCVPANYTWATWALTPRNTFWGLDATRKFENITFKDCYYNGVRLCSFSDGNFDVNSFNQNVSFMPCSVISSSISSSYCRNTPFNIQFTATGTYNSGNVFTAQLSNASGSFASPTTLGTLNSTTAGTISATIPNTVALGSGYKIRIVSSNLSVIDNPSIPFEVVATCPPPCPTSINLASVNTPPTPSDDIGGGIVLMQANMTHGTIAATNKITGTAKVTYQAKSILLNNGFKADTGTVFIVQVGGCN